jgi:methionyl-tRNA formyltransferase
MGDPALRLALFTNDYGGELLLRRVVPRLPGGIGIALVVTRPDSVFDRGRNPVTATCRELGLPFLQMRDGDQAAVAAGLQEAGPDYVVVSNFHRILRRPVIGQARLGAFNIHSSLLPRYRGATAIAWALIHGERETGATLHVLTEGVDDGDLLMQRRVRIRLADNSETLYTRVALAKARLLAEFLGRLAAGDMPVATPQDERQATWQPKRSDEHGRIDLSRPLLETYNLIRGFDPWPGAHVLVGGEPVRLRGARVLERYVPPGVDAGVLTLARRDEPRYRAIQVRAVSPVMGDRWGFDGDRARAVVQAFLDSEAAGYGGSAP